MFSSIPHALSRVAAPISWLHPTSRALFQYKNKIIRSDRTLFSDVPVTSIVIALLQTGTPETSRFPGSIDRT
jgi:hypothetical protein